VFRYGNLAQVLAYDNVGITIDWKLGNDSLTAAVLQYVTNDQQELSYRKQIARKLRTQYVKGIYSPKYYTVTLKSMLRVTQGHWKRNHWTDHTRLTISRVI